ncbi:MAG: hypothetical protein J6P72_11130 [Firmicutes bacterium]|nr:hypothetical protein [Bacillota bacterium]
MTLSNMLDQDRERLLRQLSGAKTPEKAQTILVKELDRLFYAYTESEKEDHGGAALFETAKSAAAFLCCQGESQLWERKIEKKANGRVKEARHVRIYAVCLLCFSLILLSASYFMPLVQNRTQFSWITLLLLLLGGALAFLGGLRLIRPDDHLESEYQIETRLDPEAMYSALKGMVLVMEQNLKDAKAKASFTKEKKQQEKAGGMDRAQVELFCGLLEAAYSKDGEYALQEAGKVKFYLHGQGIEALDYTDGNKSMFDLITIGEQDPYASIGTEKKETIVTLRPALRSGSRLLKKGLAGKQIR